MPTAPSPVSFPVLERAARTLVQHRPEEAAVTLTSEGSVRIESPEFEGGWLELTPDELVGALLEDAASTVDLLVGG